MLHLIECECKHCGAPMGVRSTTQERWDAHPSNIITSDLTNHRDNEVEFEVTFPMKVKLSFVSCRECSSMF